jgi:alpha-beta hydrolase superfamily lysophospholipase
MASAAQETLKTSGTVQAPRSKLRRWSKLLLIAFAVAFVLLNGLMFMHARSMTHFAGAGAGPKKLEELTLFEKVKLACVGPTIHHPLNKFDPTSVGLEFTSVRYPSSDGIALEAWHVPCPGAKGLVLLFHGYVASKASLLPEAKILHELGYATLLVDFRGCGGSTGDFTTIGFTEADDVTHSMEHALAQWPAEPIILYGQSMGGAAVLRALHKDALRPVAVVIECSFDRLMSAVEARLAEVGSPKRPLAVPLIFWGGVQHGFNGFGFNPADYARSVQCPVLLNQGDEDRRVAPADAEAIFANLAGPKELYWFRGLGHQSYASARPEEWRADVENFLSRYGPNSKAASSDSRE